MFGNTKFFYSFAAAIKRKTMEVKIIQMEVSEFKTTVKGLMMEVLTEYQLAAQQDAPAIDDLIGTAEACKILGCSSRTLQRYRDRKCFTVIMRGPHKALYHRSEILAFREANARSNRNNLK